MRRYDEGSAETSALRFQADAADAARAGYLPASQTWEGSALIVTYQHAPSEDAAVSPGPARRVHVPSLVIGIGGVLVAIGSILPWVRLGTVSTGTEGSGLVMSIVGLGLVLIGLAGVTNERRARQLRSLAIIGGLAAFLIAVVNLWNVSFDLTAAPGQPLASAIGEGLWVSLAGAVIALAAALRTIGAPDPAAGSRPRRRGAAAIWLVLAIIAVVAVGLLIALSGGR